MGWEGGGGSILKVRRAEGGVEVDGRGDGEDLEIGRLGEGGLEGCACCAGAEGGDGYGGGFAGARAEEFEVDLRMSGWGCGRDGW